MAKCNKYCSDKDPARLNKVGGQAVLEGVMMKAGHHTVTTCRKDDGSLVVTDSEFHSIRKKYKILNIPILRGVVNMIEMLMLSYKTLGASADALGLDDDKKKDGKESPTVTIIMIISMILGIALSIGLFIVLPGLVSDLVAYLAGGISPTWKAMIEGVSKLFIFMAYLFLVGLVPDIKRTFMYHGAEHKSIACFESGAELTPANAKNYTRFHPRCGTSFMFVMILLGIAVGIVVNNVFTDLGRLYLSLIRIGILPLVVGLGYEFIMFAGKHDNVFTRALSAPGLWIQRLTTKEPTEDMLEVAIISIKCALRDDFPEFHEFYLNREWEPAIEVIGEPVECDEAINAPAKDTVMESAPEEENKTDEAI